MDASEGLQLVRMIQDASDPDGPVRDRLLAELVRLQLRSQATMAALIDVLRQNGAFERPAAADVEDGAAGA